MNRSTPFLLCALFAALCSHAGAADRPAIVSATSPYPVIGSIERLDPALDAVLAADARIEQLAVGFRWSEGPVWLPKENAVVFSDVPANTAYRWREGGPIDIFLQPSDDTALVPGGKGEGSNGLVLDAAGRLLLCQHSDRRISRLNADGKTFTTLVDRYEGKRFNSPNDLCLDRTGNIFFTDPPYGLGQTGVSEIGFNGIYRLSTAGTVTLLSRELERPNGIAFAPDGKTLYVGNSDDARPVILVYSIREDGTAGPSRVFFDASALRAQGRKGALDGMKVDVHGNLWTTGPGGVLILSPAGRLLGSVLTGRATANCCFGGPQGHTLYLTANDRLCRVETKTTGHHW
jgi:gluconolactonase